MEKNAVIKMNLDTLLSILEARAFISIYEGEEVIFSGNVYELLTNNPFKAYYVNYRVIGIVSALSITNIMVEEEKF